MRRGKTSSGLLCTIAVPQAQERETQTGTGAEGATGTSEGVESLSYERVTKKASLL